MADGGNDDIYPRMTGEGLPDGATILAGKYRVVRKLGEGATGVVYLAEDLKLNNHLCAVKMPGPLVARDPRTIERLKREAALATHLTHPNIVTFRTFEQDDEHVFLVMDYVDGETLAELLARERTLTESDVLRLFAPVAKALDYAHGQGVVHRDVKPSNILIAKNGTPKIADFGIAQELKETFTRFTGVPPSGTYPYMSPEQVRGRAPTPSQDIYSLAATMYECLAGDPPFFRADIADQIKSEPPPPLDPETPLTRQILTGLAKTPGDRPASCTALVTGVEPAKPSPPPGRPRKQGDGCPNCGATNEPAARFCEVCGEGFFEDCPACGEGVKATAPHCKHCGAHGETVRRLRSLMETAGRLREERLLAEAEEKLEELLALARGARLGRADGISSDAETMLKETARARKEAERLWQEGEELEKAENLESALERYKRAGEMDRPCEEPSRRKCGQLQERLAEQQREVEAARRRAAEAQILHRARFRRKLKRLAIGLMVLCLCVTVFLVEGLISRAPDEAGVREQNEQAEAWVREQNEQAEAGFARLLRTEDWRAAVPPRNPQGRLEAVQEKTGLTFVLVPAGIFEMGSEESEVGRMLGGWRKAS